MKKIKLGDVCNFSEKRIAVTCLDKTNYISTDNLLPNKGGITDAATLPKTSTTPAFVAGNVLLSNIRPYFKKIWYATFDGGCSADVLVLKVNESIDAKFLYYALSEVQYNRTRWRKWLWQNHYYETPSGNFKISPLDGENLCFHHRVNLNTNITQDIRTNRNNNSNILKEDKSDIRSYGCLYSKSRSGFNTRPVKSTTTEKLDSNKYDSDSNEDFTSIKQLIIDIYVQDALDFMNKNSDGKSFLMTNFQKNLK